MTQEELGKELGWTGSAISNIELGKSRVSAEDLARIAQVLGVSADYLVREELTGEPDLDIFMAEIKNMTPEERASVELAIRFVKERRKREQEKGEHSTRPGAGGAP